MAKNVRLVVQDKTHAKAHYIANVLDISANEVYPAALECLINFHGLDNTVEYIRDFLPGAEVGKPLPENGGDGEEG